MLEDAIEGISGIRMTKISVASAFHKLIVGLAPPAAAFVSWIHFVSVALVGTKPAGMSIVDCRKLLASINGWASSVSSARLFSPGAHVCCMLSAV